MNSWIALLVQQLLNVISPELRKAVADFVLKLEADAKKTANPWDDILVGFLKGILQIP